MKSIGPIAEKNLYRIAIIVAQFNETITDQLLAGAIERLHELGFSNDYVTVIQVPGAVEIPLAAQRLAKTELYEAIICLGTVIQGETNHYDYVCEQVSQGCQRVALDQDIPVVFGVLTTKNEEQALARAGGSDGHKGIEAVDTAVEMVAALKKISSL
jgi:6,7-dimethyl-8-ribityllumazine synthase